MGIATRACALALGTLLLAPFGAGAQVGSAGSACERGCLIALMDNYLAALVAGDPSALPLADDVANMPYDPFDMPAAHIFKVGADGLVHEIEAVGFTAPYNSPTGWE